jgi:hypothetical protein
VFQALKLTSAAAFRHKGELLAREDDGKGWENCARTLPVDAPAFSPLAKGAPFTLKRLAADPLGLPSGQSHPVLGVPAANSARCFALALYGAHESGNDLDHNERAMLARIAHDATAIYAELENEELRQRVAGLERELTTARTPAASQRTS